MTGTIILLSAIAVALVIGVAYQARNGAVRDAGDLGGPERSELLNVGVSTTGATVLHFSADWCGPCAAVRRVVANTLRDFPEVTDIELDIDANPQLSKLLGVLSLPTTFIFDASLKQSKRIAGVPKAEELRAALVPLSGQVG